MPYNNLKNYFKVSMQKNMDGDPKISQKWYLGEMIFSIDTVRLLNLLKV